MRFLPILCLASSLCAADPAQQAVFTAGEGGYHTYRIPSAIVTPKGTVLAFCEGRKNNRGDAGDIDLLQRRSRDNGQTWEPTRIVWDEGQNTCGNPCPVIDRETGTIHLLLTHNLRQDTEKEIVEGTSEGSRTVWISRSTDDGETWSRPVEITRTVKRPDWTWYATGPGIGIQTKSGRLIVPCDNKVAGTQARQSHVIYSDDHGNTWTLGGVVGPDCNESQIAELSDGALLLNMRSYQANNLRMVAISRDGGVTFTPPKEDPALIEPVCQASLIQLTGRELLFSNPASRKRENLTVRLSLDDGQTWAHSKVLHPGFAAYSCLTVLPDGTFGCLYERGEENPYQTIMFARFDRAWVAGK